GDHCMVAWQGPGVPTRTIIPGTNLSPYEPLKAYGAKPTNRATGVTQTPVLEWKPGIQAASHELYFGTDEDVVRNATKASSEYIGPRALGDESYDPGKLVWESTYYWRVDEVNNTNPDSPWVGSVWNFTTADYAIVDDFEDYNITDKQIWAIWHDGIGYWDLDGLFHPGNGTGSGVGDEMPYFYNNNDPAKMKYSEAKKTLINTRDWTEGGVKALSLWFQGIPASTGSFTDNLDGTYTMTASGADIWNVPDFTGAGDGYYHDEFHFAYKPLTGAGSIIARVDSLQNTASSAKAGVMIRETLDANSVHVMMVVTPTDGVKFERRPTTGSAGAGDTVTGITAPQWVKLERDLGGFYTASYSDDGLNWTIAGVPEPIGMGPNAFIGLVVTSHDAALTCQAEFSNVQLAVSGPWSHQDIGIQSNDPERMYVAISNSNGTTGTVYYENNENIDTDATQIDTWTEFNIDLKDFQDQGVNLADVNSVAIGFGTRGSTTNGSEGKMYIDDIRLYRPRYVLGKGTPIASDITTDGVVDYRDVETMAGDWLASEYNGLWYEYFEGAWDLLPDFDSLIPVKQGSVNNFDISVRNQDDNFGFRFSGQISITTAGDYTFYTTSDDGSKLYINGTMVVDNDSTHGMEEQSGTIPLTAGNHTITVTMFELGGGEGLEVEYEGPGITPQQPIPDDVLHRSSSAGDLELDEQLWPEW
ncbi:MAG: PA14 domain-containing protein, partial [Planctomycetota bacterium]